MNPEAPARARRAAAGAIRPAPGDQQHSLWMAKTSPDLSAQVGARKS